MNAFEVTVVVATLLVLRLAIPLALTLFVCCGLNRILARWNSAT